MSLVLTAAHKGGEHTLPHDLNFQKTRYEATHVIVSYDTPKTGFWSCYYEVYVWRNKSDSSDLLARLSRIQSQIYSRY